MSSMIALMSLRVACASPSTSASLASYSSLWALYPITSGGTSIFAITMRRRARARSSDNTLSCAKCAITGVYLADSSSSRWPTRPTITIDRTDIATMRMVNPTTIATIRRLIDCLIIDPDSFFKLFSVRVLGMAFAPRRARGFCSIIKREWPPGFDPSQTTGAIASPVLTIYPQFLARRTGRLPVLMLWTAPPPAHRCHGCGGC